MAPTNNNNDKKRRLALACAAVGLIDLLLLALLLFLPYDCAGHETVEEESRPEVVEHDTVWVQQQNDSIDQAVEQEGGNVDGFMRFSITWNQDGHDRVDLDAHAVEPGGAEIYWQSYKKPRKSPCGGQLDIDKIRPSRIGVENIYWDDASTLRDGTYRFFIDNYDGGRNRRCDVKLKVGAQSFIYEVSNVKEGHPCEIAKVTIKDHQVVNIQHSQTPAGGQ